MRVGGEIEKKAKIDIAITNWNWAWENYNPAKDVSHPEKFNEDWRTWFVAA